MLFSHCVSHIYFIETMNVIGASPVHFQQTTAVEAKPLKKQQQHSKEKTNRLMVRKINRMRKD